MLEPAIWFPNNFCYVKMTYHGWAVASQLSVTLSIANTLKQLALEGQLEMKLSGKFFILNF